MKLTKNIFHLSLFLAILLFSLVFAFANRASATGAASFPQDTTLNLTVGGVSTNFTIVGGSDADTVVANNNGSVTVTISSGEKFTLQSADRKALNNDGGVSYNCNTDKSIIILSVSASTTIIITPSSSVCDASTNGASGGGGGGGYIAAATPTPTPTSSPLISSTPTPAPTLTPISTGPTPVSRGFTNLSVLKLKEGDTISASGSSDPDVYIVNAWGYKRLFLNPVIFKFYGHLGGFSKVKKIAVSTRDTLVTSGLFRNCETNDKKVYGLETTGEDTGILHWVNTTGAQAVADDPDFFKKVFCINSKELNWYKQSTPYTSVSQIPSYIRTK